MPKTETTRDRILREAAQIFYRQGYRATGVEAVARAAGITKATLYHHFVNKEALIEATLLYLSAYHRTRYVAAWNQKGLSARQRLTVLFDAMGQAFRDPLFFGCPFINVAGEFTERDSAPRRVCVQHYQFLISHLEQFARDAKLGRPRELAEQIASLIAGAYSGWVVIGLADAAKQGKKMAETLIAAHSKTR